MPGCRDDDARKDIAELAMKTVSVVLAALAVAAASYGTYLLITVSEEFDPRGRFGIYALMAAALSGGLAFLAWRRTR